MTDLGVVASTEPERLRSLLLDSTCLTEEAVALARALGPDVSGRIVAEIIDAPFAANPVGSPIRAAHLARELRLDAAVEPLVRFVERMDVRLPVTKTVLSVLARLGPAGGEGLLSLLERSSAEDRSPIYEVLARAEVDDARLRKYLARLLVKDPVRASRTLAQRGDWRAVPDLLRALDALSRHPVADCAICAADDLSAIGSAVIALSGTLSEEYSSKIDEAHERAEPMWTELEDDWLDDHLPPRTPAVREPRPGRNDPCPCGSGKKFKRCCLDAKQVDPHH
jgi:hypothetical protein